MNFKFKVGQTVQSPFGVVKIINRWKGRDSIFYDIKYIRTKNNIHSTATWTFEEHEMAGFTSGGVAHYEDDAVEIINIEEVDNELIATISVWIQIKLNDKFYSFQKQFKEKLDLV